LEKARIAGSTAEGTALPCRAWMHFAGGETSAGRPGTTWMMFLAVFYVGDSLIAFYGALGAGTEEKNLCSIAGDR
jgi:hypothetical protein